MQNFNKRIALPTGGGLYNRHGGGILFSDGDWSEKKLINDETSYKQAILSYIAPFLQIIKKVDFISRCNVDINICGVKYSITLTELHFTDVDSTGLHFNDFGARIHFDTTKAFENTSLRVLLQAPSGHFLLPKSFTYNKTLTSKILLSCPDFTRAYQLFLSAMDMHARQEVELSL